MTKSDTKKAMKVDRECRELFNRLTEAYSNELRWAAAEELSASIEGVLMERGDLGE